MKIKRNKAEGTLRMSQEASLTEVLMNFGMEDTTARITPLPAKLTLLPDGDATEKPYQSLVGALMYPMRWT